MTGSDEGAFLDLLYSAAARPDLWVEVMERFADMIGGTACWLSRLDQRDGTGSGIIARIDPAMPALYTKYYAGRNPFTNLKDPLNIAVLGRPCVTTDHDRMPKEDFVRTEYYNDFLKPQSIDSILMIGLALNGFEGCLLNLGRPEAKGQFGTSDLETTARLHPHLIRAFNLTQRLAADRALNQGADAVFAQSTHGLFQLDRAGGVVRINAAGEALLRQDCGLTVRGGRLIANAADAARRLEALIAVAAAVDPERRAGGSMALASPVRALPLSIIVAPLRADDAAVFHSQPSVLVCVTDLEAGANLSARKLRELFQFTPAEARLAVALHDGASPREAAASLGISIHTANIHIGRIFDKTGVNKQSALLRLLTRAEGMSLD
jgi:DNA-binding CsgD family transcriptional regulator/PAS domain-containing protein